MPTQVAGNNQLLTALKRDKKRFSVFGHSQHVERYIYSNFCLFANIVIDIINSRSRESIKPRLIQTMKKPTDPDDRVLDQLFA